MGVEGGSIGRRRWGKGKREVRQWAVASQASVDPGTLVGKRKSSAHLPDDFPGGSMRGREAAQAGCKWGIREPWEEGLVLRGWMVKWCPMGSLDG